VLKKPEPMSGLEPLTCRLRNDPTLRMLLSDISGAEWFWCVSRHSGKRLCSSSCSSFWNLRSGFPTPKIGYSARCCAAAAPFTP